MRFHVCVGILPHEADFAQPLEVDLTVWASPAAAGALAVDYRDLYAVVSSIVGQQPLHFLETIGQQVAAGALAQPAVTGARVAVRKPHVALAGLLDYAEVVVQEGDCA
jgi:dihydroneopterin aldolase